jgi:hypothetical protein
MPLRRMGRPGLIGMAARTAVVAGTATAVSGSVQRHQQEKAQGQYEQQQYEAAQQQAQIDAAAQQAAAQYAQPAAAPAAPAAPAGGTDLVAELQKLAALKDAGILSDQEFAAAKAKLIGRASRSLSLSTPEPVEASSGGTAPRQARPSSGPGQSGGRCCPGGYQVGVMDRRHVGMGTEA